MRTFLSCLLVLFYIGLKAQVPFTSCPGKAFVVLSEAPGTIQPTTLFEVRTNNNISLDTINPQNIHINAIGYNPIDDFLYGLNDPARTGRPDLYRIDANGDEYFATVINAPSGGILGAVLGFVGDVDSKGIFYVPAIQINSIAPFSYSLYLGRIDLNNLSYPITTPDYSKEIIPDLSCQALIQSYITNTYLYYIGLGVQPSGGIQDWAFSPNDGKLWSYLGPEASVFVLDTATGTASCYPTANSPKSEFGGIYFDYATMDMYGFEVDAGKTFKIDINNCPGIGCGTLTEGDSYSARQRGDAASCITDVNLPIELISFKGEWKDDVVHLEWKTASEKNNDYFIVQRSLDGVFWDHIDYIDGAGTISETREYKAIDKEPYEVVTYYRLKQIDFDRKSSYSNIVVIKNPNTYSNDAVEIFPNPVYNVLKMRLISDKSTGGYVAIFDSYGRELKRVRLSTKARSYEYLEIDMSGYDSGIYFVKIVKTNGHQHVRKFIKETF